MTELTQFVSDALKTESTVDSIKANEKLLINTIAILIGAGNILDQIKKNTFYDKPYDIDTLFKLVQKISIATKNLNTTKPEDIVGDKKTFGVNPRMFHSIVGISTEATELLEALDFSGENMDNVNIAEEFGDIDWYKAIGTDEMGIEWVDILTTIINKLKARYPNAYTSEDAINRNLDKERSVLEQVETT